MIPVPEAQAMILGQCRQPAHESVLLAKACGRVLATEVDSPVDLPPFDNSAMDGFALAVGPAGAAVGSEHEVQGEAAAGDAVRELDAGACEIMTGAPMPKGCNAVAPVEVVEVLRRDTGGRPSRIRLRADIRVHQNVRSAGEDIACGARAFASGQWLEPAHLMLLAGIGIAEVEVARKPRVAVLCTGRELVDDATQVLASGQIRNSNGPYLHARLQAGGADVVLSETVPDDPDAFRAALERALSARAEVVVSTGAVSMGRYDFVPAVLAEYGAELLFHKVAMRPGKPLLFARLAQGPLFFGLPGNPVSAAVGLRFFVEPALRRLLGLPDEAGWRLPLAQDARKPRDFHLFQKAVLRLGRDGRASASLLPGQESFKTLPLARASAWIVLPAGADALRAGDCVEVYPLGHELGGLFGKEEGT